VAVARPRCGATGWAVRLACASAACGSDATVVRPVVDVPVDDPDATASGLDEIALTVAHAGSDRDLVAQTFARGEALDVPGAPFADDLVLHMSGFIGASGVAYGRTCMIAVTANQPPPTPHVLFSRSVKFASLGIAPLPRTGGLGIAYLGTALLVGGTHGGGPISEVESFDPLTGQLTTVGLVLPRQGAVQALIGTSPPRAVVIGGAVGAEGAKFIEVVDSRRVERLEFADMARVELTATALTDGRVVVIGGRAPGMVPTGEIDELAPDGASYAVRRLTARLAHPRRGHTATRLGEDVGAPVLIAGGLDAAALPIDVVELFKPLSEELANPARFAPRMLVPRSGHVATLMPDGSVLFIGGLDALGQPVRSLELFSVDAGFVDVGDLPEGAGAVEQSATTLPDGRILLAGGRLMPGTPALTSAYIARLNPLNGSVDVVATDRLAVARAGHQAVTLCDGTVLVTGGISSSAPAERYNPPPIGRR
jgi:hypothetical protein